MPIETLLKKDIANSIAQIWHCTELSIVSIQYKRTLQ